MRSLIPAVLREERQFARYFYGQALSMVGDRISFVIMPFAVLSIPGADAADVGLVSAATLVPFLVFALAGGVWADRLPRQRVMLVSDLVRFVSQAMVAVLLLTGAARISHLVVLMAVFGTADAFFAPAAGGLMPLIVGPERLQEANALRGLVMSTGLVAGPALAGGLIFLVGPGGAIALDALSFAVSAAFLARLRPRAADPADAPRGGFLAQLREGFTEVMSRTWVWSTLAALSVYHVVVLPSVFVLGPVLSAQEFGGAAAWSVVVAAFGVGSVVGDVIALRVRIGRPLVIAAAALAVASCQALIIGAGPTIPVIAALEAVTGVAVALAFTMWETSLQANVPQAALSRVSSYDYLLTAGLMPLGLAVAGPIAQEIGLRPTLYGMTLLGVPAALALLAVPAVRRMRAPEPVAQPVPAPAPVAA
ncbi:MFS transporter [Catellatospora coxensis]|uniref:MFS transporter n=1 Tax=Catellatospora coxensis TaxID=310354 RepID=A0A8J3P746_9ACTN|nr:MFS transporter [Catellatospora coxensis]GIG06093.1 MFS transporter [Catellatospora coxensis]